MSLTVRMICVCSEASQSMARASGDDSNLTGTCLMVSHGSLLTTVAAAAVDEDWERQRPRDRAAGFGLQLVTSDGK